MTDATTEQHEEPIINAEEAVAAGDAELASQIVDSLALGEGARMMSQLETETQHKLLDLLSEEQAAELIEQIPDAYAAQLVSHLSPQSAAAIFEHLHSDEQADLINRMADDDAEAILDEMDPKEARDVRRLREYETDVAGGLMVTEYLSYRDGLTVDDVLVDLRKNADKYSSYDVQYAYVRGTGRRLVGVLRLRDLLLSPRQTPIRETMITKPLNVLDTTSLSDLQHFFDRHALFGVPVVDEENRLLGVVRRASVEHAAEEAANQTFLKFMGILGGEELRSLPLHSRSARRLSWLSINILLNIMAASIIAMHQDTLSAVIALAVFLPIISDMSGCSGSQAVAVSMRELSLGLIKPSDFLRVFRKEATLGLINGVALGVLLGAVGMVWQNSWALGVVVGGAMALNTVVAVSIGGLVPLLLRSLKFDPALASGPILTTLTDMCGFFLVLSFARMMLPYLT